MSPRVFQRKSLRGQAKILSFLDLVIYLPEKSDNHSKFNSNYGLNIHDLILTDFPRYYLKAVLIINESELRGPALEQILNQNI